MPFVHLVGDELKGLVLLNKVWLAGLISNGDLRLAGRKIASSRLSLALIGARLVAKVVLVTEQVELGASVIGRLRAFATHVSARRSDFEFWACVRVKHHSTARSHYLAGLRSS